MASGIGGCNSIVTHLRLAECKNSFKAIAHGLHNYHDVFESFPPAYIGDDRGWPQHSWRVLHLPYIAEYIKPNAYGDYRFDEDWNGPTNSQLARPMPHVYRCPADDRDGPNGLTWTSCVAIVGEHTCWPGSEPISIADISDGTSNTLLVVESHNTGIHWMEPRDLRIGQMAMTVNSAGGQGVSSSHTGGAHVVFGDGSVRFVSEHTDPRTLRRLMQRNDGEDVGEF